MSKLEVVTSLMPDSPIRIRRDWLTNHHCTCPVCRYELPTDNPLYEAGRLERMKTRKPRYAMYELRRMPVPELLAIYKQPAPGILEKEDLIDLLIRKERIQVVPAPEPVEYSLEVLKRMKIRELKRAMEHAGVFFHAKDVVEKSDMLTIFLNSGRLSLLPSENDYPVASGRKEDSGSKTAPPPGDQEKISVPSKRPLVETVQECSDDENDHGRDMPLSPPQEMFGSDGISSLFSRGPVVNEGDETVSLPARGNVALDQQPTLESNEDINDDETQGSDLPSVMEGVALSKKNDVDASGCLIETMPTRQASPPPSISEEAMIPPLISNTDAEQGHSKSIKTSSGLQYSNHGKCPFQEYTISHLQELAKINNIDVSSCFERGEMVNLLLNAGIAMKHPSEVFRENLSNFNVSELRVLASEVSIDLSQCNDKEEMLHCIVQEAMTERPHLQSYLRSLSPLAKLSLNELRRTAREWGVNINDCLEKGEIMQRLISRGQRFGGF